MHRLIASSFGLGLIPRRLWGHDGGAGTFGAVLGAVISAALWTAPPWVGIIVAIAVIAVSLWAARPFAAGHTDPGWVCIDETAGTLLAGIGLGGGPWLVAMLMARLADIFKVLPGVRAAERLPGSVGVTADDLVAGGYGLAVGWALTALVG